MRTPGIAVIATLALHVAGCGSSSTTAPTPTAVAPVTSTVGTASVSSLSPNLGSTGGATQVNIVGAGLGGTVTFGGVPVQGTFDSRSPNGLMWVVTPPHAAGRVDVVLSSHFGPPITLPGGFTYAAPETFDFNGRWEGFGWNGQDNEILFTIQNDMLLTVTCTGVFANDPDTTVTLSPPRPVTNSEFSFVGDRVNFSGRIVAPSMASGTIRLGPCASDAWYATKQ